MKILNLKIKSPDDKLVREINFHESGLSLIYGDITLEQHNKKETSNSVGKTLVLKFIDYVFGCNEKKELNSLKGYRLEAKIKTQSGASHDVARTIGSEILILDGCETNLTDYKDIFNIERSLYSKQIILESRKKLIQNPSGFTNESDYSAVLSILNMENLLTLSKEYSDKVKSRSHLVTEVKRLEIKIGKTKKEIDKYYGELEAKIKESQEKKDAYKKAMESLNVNSAKDDMVKELTDLNKGIDNLRSKLYELEEEKRKLNSYISELGLSNITSKDVKNLYDIANKELPGFVIKRIDEVNDFYKNLFAGRKELILRRIAEIDKESIPLRNSKLSLTTKASDIGKALSNNEIYTSNADMYNAVSENLNTYLKDKNQLDAYKNVLEDKNNLDLQLADLKAQLIEMNTKNSKLIKTYENYLKKMFKYVYPNTKDLTSFDVKVKEKNKSKYSIEIKYSINKEAGDGYGNAKILFFDFLLCYLSKDLNFLILDSQCFDGITPDRVDDLIKIITSISNLNNKQLIIAINKFQLGAKASKEFIDKVKVLQLSSNDNLLHKEFN